MVAIQTMSDYEVHVNIYTALGSMLMSPHLEVRQAVQQHGGLKEVEEAQDNSPFFKVRRICSTVVSNLDDPAFTIQNRTGG
jgi:hypothetical protein